MRRSHTKSAAKASTNAAIPIAVAAGVKASPTRPSGDGIPTQYDQARKQNAEEALSNDQPGGDQYAELLGAFGIRLRRGPAIVCPP